MCNLKMQKIITTIGGFKVVQPKFIDFLPAHTLSNTKDLNFGALL